MWILVTLVAATFQTLRTARQHELRGVLDVNAAGWVRYAYGFPFASIAALVTFTVGGGVVPDIPLRFWLIVTAAGTAQILATVALLTAFRRRNFAVGTVYAKTEVIQVAVISAILLGEPLRLLGWIPVAVCMFGVTILATGGNWRVIAIRAADPAALMGIVAGGLFGAAAVGIRAASESLGTGPAWPRAILTSTVMLGIQTLLNGAHLQRSAPAELRAAVHHWRPAAVVGLLSVAGSISWAVAVTLENAAKVRVLGQIELVLTFAVSVFVLRERHRRSDIAASAMVLAGVVGVIGLG